METEQQQPSNGKRKPWAAYNIIERKDTGKRIWSRVGSAFFNQDGSINIHLDSFPLQGKIQIREDDRERRPDAAKGALAREAEA